MSINAENYGAITSRFIEALEEGVVPWHQTWAMVQDCNPRTHTVYRGINTILLALTKLDAQKDGRAYNNLWSTYNGWRAMGGHVMAGEHGTNIYFWKPLVKNDGDKVDVEGNPQMKTFFILKRYTVFNHVQTEGVSLPERYIVVHNDHEVTDAEAWAGALWDMMPDKPIEIVDTRCYYRPSVDTVALPERESFHTAADYWAAKFHEYVHSTAHEKRLNRELGGGFGSEKYSKEELIAEMGAAFLLGRAGLLDATFDNNASYIKGWLKVLKDDPKMVVQAASAAEKAAEYIAPSNEKEMEEAA